MNRAAIRRFLIPVLVLCVLLGTLRLPCRAEEAEADSRERFTLTFVGDCTFGGLASTYNAQVGFLKTVGEDYGYPFRMVEDYFREDEATFLNLEGPLFDREKPAVKKYVFRGPTQMGAVLTENSVEAVSVANNHTEDHGREGYESTLAVLEQREIPCAKTNESTLFVTKNGITVGLYGAVYYLLDEERILADIQALAAQEPDILIFAPHWGSEGSYQPNAQQIRLGRAAIDAGADIVWGSHPHVLQPVEHYQDGVIYYSLGNFSFGGNGDPRDYDTALIQQEILRDEDGTVSLGETSLVPCCISGDIRQNDYQPVPYGPETPEYERTMKKLTGQWHLACIPIG